MNKCFAIRYWFDVFGDFENSEETVYIFCHVHEYSACNHLEIYWLPVIFMRKAESIKQNQVSIGFLTFAGYSRNNPKNHGNTQVTIHIDEMLPSKQK